MKFQSKVCTLKSGKQITVRVPEDKEAEGLMDLKRGYIENTSTLPWTLEEYPKDIRHELDIIEEYRESPNGILLVAEYDGELIGNLDITGNKRLKMAHTGMVGMGIKENWRNQGLGKALMESAIEWAKNNTELEILWLDVYASNELGYHLYKNTGFEVSGIIKGFFKEENGYMDKIQMYQRIK
ncbi:GNAT family N-acetyltransferase [Lewinella cohaerens]|uniref:GNAT family N-acetyltransferase n=1 Tax=Lewinella cohaerens TaxID=70995 RepID=UPI0003655A0E|nr:GNAT family N-acetyltransferase [Lewinella cohaerens]